MDHGCKAHHAIPLHSVVGGQGMIIQVKNWIGFCSPTVQTLAWGVRVLKLFVWSLALLSLHIEAFEVVRWGRCGGETQILYNSMGLWQRVHTRAMMDLMSHTQRPWQTIISSGTRATTAAPRSSYQLVSGLSCGFQEQKKKVRLRADSSDERRRTALIVWYNVREILRDWYPYRFAMLWIVGFMTSLH
jgi:hypothetical protein